MANPIDPALPAAVPVIVLEMGMVTKLSDERGQITIKAHAITNEWEQLIKAAAQSNGQTVADFIVTVTTLAAQAILKGESAPPVRSEDVADKLREVLTEELSRRDAERRQQMAALVDDLRRDQAEAVAEIQRNARRGRWR